MKVGVLALQGDFAEHAKVLAHIGTEPVEVRLPQHLEGLNGLIIPGGESTTIGQIAKRWGLLEPIRAFARSGRPLLGTCAGMILMAKEVVDGIPGQPLLELMDITVRRNAFGRQVDSFEADLEIPALGEPPFHTIFIRAPLIERVKEGVEVLARLEPALSGAEGERTVVAARQENLLVAAFHPELMDDDRFHRYFVGLSEVG
jgi:5'-phosphate synthase pdxT subunit